MMPVLKYATEMLSLRAIVATVGTQMFGISRRTSRGVLVEYVQYKPFVNFTDAVIAVYQFGVGGPTSEGNETESERSDS